MLQGKKVIAIGDRDGIRLNSCGSYGSGDPTKS